MTTSSANPAAFSSGFRWQAIRNRIGRRETCPKGRSAQVSPKRVPSRPMPDQEILAILEKRLGRRYARQRLGIEKDNEAQVFGQG